MVMNDFIEVYENAYSRDFCQRAMQFFDQMHDTGLTENRQKYEGAPRTKKHDDAVYMLDEITVSMYGSRVLSKEFMNPFWDIYYADYVEKYAAIKEAGPHTIYCYNIQKTPIGGGYHVWHFESAVRAVSNRLLVWSLYLNDVEEGGETEFLYQHKRIKAKQGTLVIWPASFTHTHRGNPPLSNDKYIMTGWLEY
jgi:hypothetical protein